MNKKKLLRKIKSSERNDIIFIIEKLTVNNDLIRTIEQDKTPKSKKLVLSDRDIDLLKESLLVLINQDDIIFNKVMEIWKDEERIQIADIGIGETLISITALIVFGTVVNNVIRALIPNQIIVDNENNRTEIYRDYERLSDSIKLMIEIKKDENKED